VFCLVDSVFCPGEVPINPQDSVSHDIAEGNTPRPLLSHIYRAARLRRSQARQNRRGGSRRGESPSARGVLPSALALFSFSPWEQPLGGVGEALRRGVAHQRALRPGRDGEDPQRSDDDTSDPKTQPCRPSATVPLSRAARPCQHTTSKPQEPAASSKHDHRSEARTTLSTIPTPTTTNRPFTS